MPQLVIVGFGPVAEALSPAAALLGWQTRTVSDPGTAGGLIAALAGPDKLVVASHDQAWPAAPSQRRWTATSATSARWAGDGLSRRGPTGWLTAATPT